MLRTLPVVLLTCLSLAACQGGTEPVAAPTVTPDAASATPSPSPTAPALTEADLLGLLLAPEDVPQVPIYLAQAFPGPFPSPAADAVVPPFLCRDGAPRSVGNADVTVSTEPQSEVQRGPRVTQVLQVWPDEDAARQVFEARKEAAQACGDYTATNGVDRTVRLLGSVEVPPPAEAFQYESEQRPPVPVPADLSTEVVVGRVTFSLRSSVQAPAGLTVLGWQTQLAARGAEKIAAAAP